MSAIRAASVPLVSPREQAAIAQELAALQADQPEAVREQLVPGAWAGVRWRGMGKHGGR